LYLEYFCEKAVLTRTGLAGHKERGRTAEDVRPVETDGVKRRCEAVGREVLRKSDVLDGEHPCKHVTARFELDSGDISLTARCKRGETASCFSTLARSELHFWTPRLPMKGSVQLERGTRSKANKLTTHRLGQL